MGRAKQRADRIRKEINIADVLANYGYFVHAEYGGEEQFRCDLHGDGNDNKPSARVYPDSNSFYCFACSRSRDPIELVREKEGVGFWDAVKLLEKQYKLPHLPWDDSYADEGYQRESRTPVADQLAEVLSSDKTYEDERNGTRRTLEMHTQDRELPLNTLLSFWEAFDKVSYMVVENLISEDKGKRGMLSIRARLYEKTKEVLS